MALLTAAFVAITAPPSSARDDDPEHREAVRRVVEAGEVLPLSKILEKIRVRVPGDITGIEINREEGRWHYELRVIDRGGRVLEVHVDAHSGNIEQIEVK
ncbi:PepSY domain-containing protein [Bradyrhizobium sp. JR3.5]